LAGKGKKRGRIREKAYEMKRGEVKRGPEG